MHASPTGHALAVVDGTAPARPTGDPVSFRTSIRNAAGRKELRATHLYTRAGQVVGHIGLYSSPLFAGTREEAPLEKETVGSVDAARRPDPL